MHGYKLKYLSLNFSTPEFKTGLDMYGPGTGSGGSGSFSGASRGPPRERKYTPPGQMSGGANQRPPLQDLLPHMKAMFDPDPPIESKPPMPEKVISSGERLTGIAAFITPDLFEKTTPEKEPFVPPKIL